MYNVLVCDDDKEIVEAIEIYLKREGYNILKAYNGREALKIVKENDDKQKEIIPSASDSDENNVWTNIDIKID